jgi:hypothetical protein
MGAVIGAGLAFLVTVVGFRRLTRGSVLKRDENALSSTRYSVP